MKIDSDNWFTIPGWESIPSLVHGFGNKNWQLTDFDAHPVLRNFEIIFLHQIHSDILHIVDKVPEEMLSGDALLTIRRGLLLVIKTADCLPVLIVDPETNALAAIHCGWRSIGKMLIGNVIFSLKNRFHCDPSSLWVALGPCIGKDCYEVGEDVKKRFEKKGLLHEVFVPHPQRSEKYFLDLRMAAKHQLMDSGIDDSHISSVDLCTHCEQSLFSFRRSRQKKGRMLSFIGRSMF